MIRFSIALTLFLVTAPTFAADPPKLNFIFILIDDMGWRDLGCQGSTYYQTPNIDRLAASGMRFTSAYAACPVCSPTRASIMTGRYPPRYNVTDWLPGRKDMPSQKLLRPKINLQVPLEEITVAEALKPAGYVSANIGKWHLGGPDHWPDKQGFDVNVGGATTGSPPGGYFKFGKAPNLQAKSDDEYLTDRLTDEAIGFIDKNKDRPFFLYLPHYTVHIPLQAKKDLIAKYEKKADPKSPQHNAVYGAMIESLDDGIGRIMKKLDELKVADRTVVFFFSDNGGLSVKEGANTPATSNAPLRTGKGYLYEGGIRVPCLVHWPGVTKPGSVSDKPVISVDFLPTILEIAGVKPPDRPIDGVSLVPLLKQAGEPKPRELYWHYPHYSNQGGRPSGAVRAGDWKLLEFYEDGKLEVYNLKDDIGEKNDLAPTMPDKVKDLQQRLAAWRKQVNAQMPTPNPDYKPAK
jgi:arylsulfatase A-like enzyme